MLTKPSGFNKISEVSNEYCCEGWAGFAIKCDTYVITQGDWASWEYSHEPM